MWYTFSGYNTPSVSGTVDTTRITKSDSWPPLAWPCPTRATHRQHLRGTSDTALPGVTSSILTHSAIQCDIGDVSLNPAASCASHACCRATFWNSSQLQTLELSCIHDWNSCMGNGSQTFQMLAKQRKSQGLCGPEIPRNVPATQ